MQVYLRDQDGRTYHKPFREGLKDFLSPNGYRITLDIEGVSLVLRKDTDMVLVRKVAEYLNEDTCEAAITIRGL